MTTRFYRWSQWKALASNKSLIYQHEITSDGVIKIWGYDHPEVIITEIFNGDVPQSAIDSGYSQAQNDADKAEFNALYLSKSNREINIDKPFCDSRLYRVDLFGFGGLALAGKTTEITYKFTSEKYLAGVRVITIGQGEDDTVDFEVVDVDGIMAPRGTVLNRFCTSWAIVPGVANQGDVVFPYVARMYQGLHIRAIYHSSGQTDVKVKLNMFTHTRTI
jgi:hypothetical protein